MTPHQNNIVTAIILYTLLAVVMVGRALLMSFKIAKRYDLATQQQEVAAAQLKEFRIPGAVMLVATVLLVGYLYLTGPMAAAPRTY